MDVYNIDMIVDWTKACERIHNTKKLDLSDQGKKMRVRQEIVYLSYLTFVLNKNPTQAFEEWKEIKNGVASLFKDDDEELYAEFYRLYIKALKNKYSNVPLGTHLQAIIIYKAEIDYINKLDVPIWVKQYWFSLLFYYKFEIQNHNKVQLSKMVNSWCIHQCLNKKVRDYNDYQDHIARHRKKTGKNIIQYYDKQKDDQYATYCPAFIKYGGEVDSIYNDIEDISIAINKILPATRTCKKCGKEFIINTKTKTDLCPECYKQYKKEKDRLRKQAERDNKRLSKK